jgi:MFS family permease
MRSHGIPGPAAGICNVRPQPVILLTCWIGLLLGVIIVVSSTFSVLFGSITAEFGWGRSQLSFAYSLFSLTSTLAMPAIGRLVDRVGAPRVIVGCTLIFAATTLLLRFVTGLWQFYALFVALGIVSGGTSTLPYFKVLIRSFAKRRGLALGIANSGTAIGMFMFPLVAYRLNAAVGWRDTYATIGIAVAIITIPVVLFGLGEHAAGSPGAPSTLDDAERSSPHSLTLTEAMRTAKFWLVGVAFFIATTALVGYLIHVVPLLRDRGLSARTAAYAASVFGAAQLLGRLSAGFLLDKLRTAFVAAGLWMLAALSFLLLWGGITGYPLLACTALAGLAFGGEGDVLAYFVSRLFGAGSFGRIYSVLLMINLLGGVVGPYLFGAAFDATGNYTAILAGVAGATLIATTLILCVRE